jgi:hypothetical protein
MTELRDERELAEQTSAALHGLRGAVRERVSPPPAATLRAAAERTTRVRRATVLVAAGAAALTLVGSIWALPRSPATPEPVGSPSASPSPSATGKPPAVPLPAASDAPHLPDDPIMHVDPQNMTLTLAPNPDAPCPSGRLTVKGAWARQGDLALYVANAPFAAYGDLTGDGRPEAVTGAACSRGSAPDGETNQLLVLSRRSDGTLTGTWAGEVAHFPGADMYGEYTDYWVIDGVIYAQLKRTADQYLPEPVRAYRWTGGAFVAVPQTRFPALLPGGDVDAAPVRLGPLAGALGCPDGDVRFGADLTARLGGARYDLNRPHPDGPGYLPVESNWVTLSGRLVLVVRVNCTRADGTRAAAVGVIAADRGRLTAIDAIPVDVKPGDGWGFLVYDGGTSLAIMANGRDPTGRPEYRWDGTHYARVS